MGIKVRTALISTALNTLLTVLKFALFALTGSLAILAEAWHSLADVGTSLAVLVAVRRHREPSSEGSRQDRDGADDEPTEAEAEPPRSRFGLIKSLVEKANAEHWVALGIGLFLSIVAVVLVLKVLFYQREPLDRPVLAGILFLVFAVGSYFVFRFETAVGREHGSVGLISDGMHSKADMIGALLTGGAMILYALGIDIDRPVALLISLFVLSFGVETLITTVLAMATGDTRELADLRTISLVLMFTDKERIKDALLQFEKATNISALDPLRTCRRYLGALRYPALGLAAIAWLATTLYTVAPTEQAILLRLGRPLNLGQPIEAGLHLKLPWPIDRPLRVDAHRVRRVNLANITDEAAWALLWTREHGTEEPFLSGDDNFFFPYLVVHYRIHDIFGYVIHHANPDGLLDSIAHSVVSRLFASLPFDDIVGQQRSHLEERIQREVQSALDELDSGIEILGVHFRDVHPPISIADSFERVIAARQEKEELINTAHGYRNQRLPEGRGEALRTVEQANAYVVERVNRAQGDAERFLLRVVDQPRARRITAGRLYLEHMSDVIAKTETVLVDPAAGTPTLLMDNRTATASGLYDTAFTLDRSPSQELAE